MFKRLLQQKMSFLSFKVLILASLLCSALTDEGLNLNDHPQDNSLDPSLQDSSPEFHLNDKRTIFGNFLNHNNYALARHFFYRNGVKYLLGYGQVDLKYTPHFKPVYIKPRPVVPWILGNRPAHQLPKPPLPVVPVKPSHPATDSWKPVHVVPPVIPIPTSKPTVWTKPIHIPAPTPVIDNASYHPVHQTLQPVKLNLPVLPFGAMFLTPVLPNHHLEYYPQPVFDQHTHIHNPHPHVQPTTPVVQSSHHTIVPGSSYEVHGHQPYHHAGFIPQTTGAIPLDTAHLHHTIVPGSSYEVHGYQPHHHAGIIPQTTGAIPVEPSHLHQEPVIDLPHYHHTAQYQVTPALVSQEDSQHPYVGSLEFHGKHAYHHQDHVIQPGHTDVQIPEHLVEHPNYRPEDYYNNYLGEAAEHYQGHIARQRSDEIVRSGSNKAPFKPSQRIYSYKQV